MVDFLKTLRTHIGSRFPDYEDLHGAVDALLRLQDLYQLPPDQVASGQLYQDIEQPVPMKCKTWMILHAAFVHFKQANAMIRRNKVAGIMPPVRMK